MTGKGCLFSILAASPIWGFVVLLAFDQGCLACLSVGDDFLGYPYPASQTILNYSSISIVGLCVFFVSYLIYTRW
jgi:hypothetical protein